MGGGLSTKPEHLLAILPFPEPTGVFDTIRKKHPHITITYRHLIFSSFDRGLQDVPKGEATVSNMTSKRWGADADLKCASFRALP